MNLLLPLVLAAVVAPAAPVPELVLGARLSLASSEGEGLYSCFKYGYSF
jgi:hypothetical protein